MRKNSRIYLFLVVALVEQCIQGCTTSVGPVISNSTPSPVAGTSSALPSETGTPTALVPFRENLVCWPVTQVTKGENTMGSLLFGTANNPTHVFAWDLGSFRVKALDKNAPTEWMLSPDIVSPDGKMIASMPYQKNELVLTSYNDSKEFSLPQGDYVGVLKFLPNGSIVIGGSTPDFSPGNYLDGSGLAVPYYIFDPTTGDTKSYSVFLPGFTIGVQGSYPFEFSADMNYIIYQSTPNSDGSARFTLIDLRTDTVLWTGPLLPANMFATNGDLPHWKPNTNTLVNILWQRGQQDYFGNYFSISLNGATTQLTKFDQTTLINPGRGGLLLPSWSPDGRYMVFRIVQPGQSFLYIWDDRDKIAYKPCLPDESHVDSGYSVFWSFDSNHILLRLGYRDSTSLATPTNLLRSPQFTDIILNMTTKTILQLPPEYDRGQYSSYEGSTMPLGWVNWQTP